MSITFDKLQELFKQEGLYYFMRPEFCQLIFGITGSYGKFQLMASLLDKGTFLQLRTLDNVYCPPSHIHAFKILTMLGDLNARYRFVKFAWDPSNGEIIGYGDHWISDNSLTQQQLTQMLAVYVPIVDTAYQRAKKILESGQDPGPLPLGSFSGCGSTIQPAVQAAPQRIDAGGGEDEDSDDEINEL